MEEERFEQFWGLISGIHRNIEKLKTKWTEPLGMKSVHIFWVYLLKDHPEGLTAAELARLSQTNRSLVSREIQNLIDLGYVYTDKNHRSYGQKLKLSQSGVEAAKKISQASLRFRTRSIPAFRKRISSHYTARWRSLWGISTGLQSRNWR